MLDIICFIGFAILAFRISKTIRNESMIFKEFSASSSTAASVWLFTLGPVCLIALSHALGSIHALLIATLFYLPALISSRQAINVFERSGTSRTNVALNAVNQAFGGAVLGFIYLSLKLVFYLFSQGIAR